MRHLAPLPRRPGMGMWSTRASGGGAAWTPATWATRRRAHWSASEGVTVTADHVSGLADLAGGLYDMGPVGALSTMPIPSVSLGAPCLTFSGSAHLMTADTPLDPTAGAQYTVYMACRYSTAAAGRCVMTTATSGGSRLSQGVAGAISGTRRVEDWIAGVAFSTSSAVARTTGLSIILSTRVGNTGNARMWVNGDEVVLSNPGANVVAPAGSLYLGSVAGSVFHTGDWFETVILDGAPESEDIDTWSAYTLALIGA